MGLKQNVRMWTEFISGYREVADSCVHRN